MNVPVIRIFSRSNADAAVGSASVTGVLKRGHSKVRLAHKSLSGFRRFSFILLSLLGLIICATGGLKAWRVYSLIEKIQQNAHKLESMKVSSPRAEDVQKAALQVESLRADLGSLRQETEPFLWLGPLLAWLPVHGGDLAAASDLLDLAENLTISASEILQAARPGLEYLEAGKALDPSEVTRIMVQMQPHFIEARKTFDRALVSRDKIEVQRLSPEIRDLIAGDLDPVLTLVDDGLSVATSFPQLMGATAEGPKTYLLLIQNEDELRPTGGFISAVGTLVVKEGRVVSLTFEDSYALDDWSKPYPVAPWQLRHYMDIPVLTLHDSNWFANYPTAVLYAEYLYALSRSHAVDGVIALDQHVLVLVLEGIGPVEVEGAPYPITADNVIAYMRSSKIPPPLELRPRDWHRKAFINKIASAVLKRFLGGGDIRWNALSVSVLQALDERHLLLQFDDASMTKVIARRGWDGAITPTDGDFLMMVDSNVGYTKSNAVLATSLFYDVDLTKRSSPSASLRVVQTNNASDNIPCVAGGELEKNITEQTYPIDLCYWGYLRVYKMQGTGLIGATPHALPAAQMILKRAVPARVDTLNNDEIEKVQAFGTLVLVPAGETITTHFQFALPASVVSFDLDSKHTIYRLKVQKQPGTLAIPLTIQLKLPPNATVLSAPHGATQRENSLSLATDLRKDVNIELIFTIP